MRAVGIVAVVIAAGLAAAYFAVAHRLQDRLVADVIAEEARARAPGLPPRFMVGADWESFVNAVDAQLKEADRLPPTEGLGRCLAVFERVRDASFGGDLLADMIAVAIAKKAGSGCPKVVARARADERAALRSALLTIRDAFPPFAAVLRGELVEMRLRGYGWMLNAEQRARLPADARQMVESRVASYPPSESALPALYRWRRQQRLDDELLAAYEGPEEERAKRLAAYAAETEIAAPDVAQYELRHGELRGSIDALLQGMAAP